jgi:hypothetical protein
MREQFPKDPRSRSRPCSLSLLFEIPALRLFSAFSAVLRVLRVNRGLTSPSQTKCPSRDELGPRDAPDQPH